jgi:MFS family permease
MVAGNVDSASHGVSNPTSEARGTKAVVIVGGATLGSMLSIGPVLTYTFGIFLVAFQGSFGWTRGEISLAQTVTSGVVILASPFAGRLADKYDPANFLSTSLLAFGVGMLAVPFIVSSPATLLFAYALVAVLGIGTLPPVIVKPVLVSFDRRRGLAIGITLAGAGIAGAILAPFTSMLVAASSWKLGFQGLGILAILAAPLVWLALRNRVPAAPSKHEVQQRGREESQEQDGLSIDQARRTRTFWIILLIPFLEAFGAGGAGPTHIFPLAVDRGMSMRDAGFIVSAMGLAGIVGRVGSGYIVDRLQTPLVGIPLLGVGGAGATIVALGPDWALPLGAICIGFSVGVNLDLIAYFTSRYFGLRSSASIIGICYGLAALSGGTGPLLQGLLYDLLGSYTLGLLVCASALGIAALACAALKPFPPRDHWAPHTHR